MGERDRETPAASAGSTYASRGNTLPCPLLGSSHRVTSVVLGHVLRKRKKQPTNDSNGFPWKCQDFQVVLSSVFDWESLEILLNFSNNTSEQIISMLPLLANNFQFWNKPFLKSLALFRNYSAKMKHLKSSQFSSFPRSVDKGGLYLWESISVWKTSNSFLIPSIVIELPYGLGQVTEHFLYLRLSI